jgi:hypothetical protein
MLTITPSRSAAGQLSATAEDAGKYVCGKLSMKLNHHFTPCLIGGWYDPVLSPNVEIWNNPDTAFTDVTGAVTFQLILDIYDNTNAYYSMIQGVAVVEEEYRPGQYREVGRIYILELTPMGKHYVTKILDVATDYIHSGYKRYRIWCWADMTVWGGFKKYNYKPKEDEELGVRVDSRYHEPWQQIISITSVEPDPAVIWYDSVTVTGEITTETGEGEPVSGAKVNIALTPEKNEAEQTASVRTNSSGQFEHTFWIINPLSEGRAKIFVQAEAKNREYSQGGADSTWVGIQYPFDPGLGIFAECHGIAPPTGVIVPYTVALVSINGYAGSVDLSVTGIPPYTSYSFDTNPIDVPCYEYDTVATGLNIETTSNTPIGLHQIEITATCGGDIVTCTCPLYVSESVPDSALFVEREHLFQDNFASDGTITGTVRADMAADIMPSTSTNILPGDSVVVGIYDPGFNPVQDPYTGFGPSVYCYVSVSPQSQPGKSGAALTQDALRFPFVDQLNQNGTMWYVIRMDTVFTDSDSRTGAVPRRFCVDLNDDLFTPGDTVSFVFGATSEAAETVFWSEFTGETDDLLQVLESPMEFTCLPANALISGRDILYVNDFSAGQAQPFYQSAFMPVLGYIPDRFDVRAPHVAVANGLGSRVQDVVVQLVGQYRTIIWDSGDLSSGTIGDGASNEKSNDFEVLYNFLNQHTSDNTGIYIAGNNIANEWATLSGADAVSFREIFMNHNLVSSHHTGVGINKIPLVIGETPSCFAHDSWPDSMLVSPDFTDLDVLAPIGPATVEMTYCGDPDHGAVVKQQTELSGPRTVRVVLSGFSFYYIRDDAINRDLILDRVHHLYDVLKCFGYDLNYPVSADSKSRHIYVLEQNYPNPFNPVTSITYSIAKDSDVELKIFDVTGALVKTLVVGSHKKNKYKIFWDGRNNAGESVASGVYFYRLIAGDFKATKKMVLLR